MSDQSHGGSLTQTFVVRLWEPPEPSWGSAQGLRGVVEHIQRGDSVAFGDSEALLGFLRERMGGGSAGGAS
jgi:hypothetical protein